jgi:hypothetical protein
MHPRSDLRSANARGQMPSQGTSNMARALHGGVLESIFTRPSRPTSHGRMHTSYSGDLPNGEGQQLQQVPENMRTPCNQVEESGIAPANRACQQGFQASRSLETSAVKNQMLQRQTRSMPNNPPPYPMNGPYPRLENHRVIEPSKKQQALVASAERQKRSQNPKATKPVITDSSDRGVEQHRLGFHQHLPPIPTSREQEVITETADIRYANKIPLQATEFVPSVPRSLNMNGLYRHPEIRQGGSLLWAQETDPVIIERRKRIYETRQICKHQAEKRRMEKTYGTNAFREHREEIQMRNPNTLTKARPSQHTKQVSRNASRATSISEPRELAHLKSMNQNVVEEPMAISPFAVVQSYDIRRHPTAMRSVKQRGGLHNVGGSRPPSYETSGHSVPPRVSSRTPLTASHPELTLRSKQKQDKMEQEAVQRKIKDQAERQILALHRKELARERASLEAFASQRAAFEAELTQARADANRERKCREHYARLYAALEQKMFMMRLEKEMHELKKEAEKSLKSLSSEAEGDNEQ